MSPSTPLSHVTLGKGVNPNLLSRMLPPPPQIFNVPIVLYYIILYHIELYYIYIYSNHLLFAGWRVFF